MEKSMNKKWQKSQEKEISQAWQEIAHGLLVLSKAGEIDWKPDSAADWSSMNLQLTAVELDDEDDNQVYRLNWSSDEDAETATYLDGTTCNSLAKWAYLNTLFADDETENQQALEATP